MKLRTEIEISSFGDKIGYDTKIFAVGSCFAERIGQRMSRAKFETVINLFGVLFNPISICNSIERIYNQQYVDRSEFIRGEGSQPSWYHFDFHSSLFCGDLDRSVESVNRAIEIGHESLGGSNWVIITLGTAWVYELAATGDVVANCHKRKAMDFRRRRLSVEEVVEALGETVSKYLSDKRVIFTVSPIRHLGDGLQENMVSKATLRLATEELVSNLDNCYYFPSFEILMDDLRDYRFYEQDMVHISGVAVDYIWERFVEAALSERAKELLPRVMQIVRAAEHRAVNVGSEAHKKFIMAQLRAIEGLSEVDFSNESEKFVTQLEINL